MEKFREGKSGITLVALVVTIIVLMTLASVSIGAVFSEKGIIQQAKDSKKQHEDAVKKEEENLNELLGEYKNSMSGTTPTPVPTPAPTSTPIPTPTPTTPAGTEVKKPSTWTSEKVSAIADGKGGIVPLPNGYNYIGGDYDTGLVISDKVGDTMDASGVNMRKPICVDTSTRRRYINKNRI